MPRECLELLKLSPQIVCPERFSTASVCQGLWEQSPPWGADCEQASAESSWKSHSLRLNTESCSKWAKHRVQNKMYSPCSAIPGARRVVHWNQWHRVTKRATFFHLFGDPELARSWVHFMMCHAPLGLWIPLLQCWTGPKAYRMFISEEMLSGLQETDILFSNPFLLVKTAFVNDFLFKS